MIIKILQEVVKGDDNILVKIKRLSEFNKYRKNLDNGIKNQKIFHRLERQNEQLENLAQNLKDEDYELQEKFFNYDVKEFLKSRKLQTNLEFEKRNISEQIGLNTIFVEKPVRGLWNTGKATFYIPTKPNHETEIIFDLQSVVPLMVTIEFEEEKLHSEKFSKLSSKRIQLKIPSSIVNSTISKISINTDTLWIPSVILGLEKSVTIGIKIGSISVLQNYQ